MAVDNLLFIQSIWKEAFLTDNSHFDEIWQSFLNKLTFEDGKTVERTCDLDRIKLFQRAFTWKPIPENHFLKFQKSPNISWQFRETGNVAYKSRDMANALSGYNLAIAFAPNGTEFLGFAFANRAAVFFYLGETELALRDINLAMQSYSNYSGNTVEKFQVRKLKCETALEQLNNRKKIKELDLTNLEDTKSKFCETRFFNLTSKNEKLKNAAHSLSVVYSPECGRRLITTKCISAGVPVLVEQPYVQCLSKILNFDTEHCANCTAPILGGLPCPLCTFCLFCNESCLKNALESSHKYEHDILPYLHSTKCFQQDDSILIIRLLSKLGPLELYKMFLQDYPSEGNVHQENDEKIAGFNGDGVYDSSTYLPVYNLVTHSERIDFETLKNEDYHKIPNEFKAVLIVTLLDQLTDFFKQYFIGNFDSFKQYVASIVLHHYLNFPYNILAFGEWTVPNIGSCLQPLWHKRAKELISQKHQIIKTTTTVYGYGIFPLAALCNHSCDPNAIFVKFPRISEAVVVTSRKIQAGEEILISYKLPFTKISFNERRRHLLESYKFLCKCYACAREYSPKDILPDKDDYVCCHKCPRNDAVMLSKLCTEECALKSNRIVDAALQIGEAKELIEKEKFCEAFTVLVTLADLLSDQHFQPNSDLFQVTQDLIRSTIVHILHL